MIKGCDLTWKSDANPGLIKVELHKVERFFNIKLSYKNNKILECKILNGTPALQVSIEYHTLTLKNSQLYVNNVHILYDENILCCYNCLQSLLCINYIHLILSRVLIVNLI